MPTIRTSRIRTHATYPVDFVTYPVDVATRSTSVQNAQTSELLGAAHRLQLPTSCRSSSATPSSNGSILSRN